MSTSSATPAAGGTEHRVLSARLEGLDAPTVWQEFSPLAVEHGAINLGQGFPDWDPPEFVVAEMTNAVLPDRGGANQYARSYAYMPLATVLADIYSARWNANIDPETQIATAVGCTNVLYCALQGLINPGDQVILLEPAFDIYSSQVRMAGGECVYVPLRNAPGDTSNEVFTLDMVELQAAITDRTKAIILNTPHNPTGKIFTRPELDQIAAIVRAHTDITILSDEVYEHIIFTGHEHISMGTILPEQTLTLSSAGKTFSCTGWKVGWAVGPAYLVQAVTAVQQWVNFSTPTPNQHAVARALQLAEQPYRPPPVRSPDTTTPSPAASTMGEYYESYYKYLACEYERKRELLIDALRAANMKPIVPPGGFFIMADTSDIDFPYDKYKDTKTAAMPASPMPRDWAMSRWLTEYVGVTAIPPSAFYSPTNIPLAQNFLRFAFCKGDGTIQEAHRRFQTYLGKR
jgi:kynurenine---oxoglutarate transaminase / cysteine-S-conjugate beta-lyase / glutamine---phenylpyruvate transaminase